MKKTSKQTKSAKPTKKQKTVVKKTPLPLKKKKSVKPKDITEIVTDYKSACNHLKRKSVLPDMSMLPEKHQKAFIAFIVLTTIIEAWNQGWEGDFTEDDYKYYVWAWIKKNDKSPSGFAFSDANYCYTHSSTDVGSRLSYKTSSLALSGAKKLEKYYLDLWTIPKGNKVILKTKKGK